MNNIKKIYQHAGKCDNQKNIRDIIDSAILSTTYRVTDDSPNVPMKSTPVKKNLLGNHCIYSPTYSMLNQKHQNDGLCLQNPNTKPRKLLVTCGRI